MFWKRKLVVILSGTESTQRAAVSRGSEPPQHFGLSREKMGGSGGAEVERASEALTETSARSKLRPQCASKLSGSPSKPPSACLCVLIGAAEFQNSAEITII